MDSLIDNNILDQIATLVWAHTGDPQLADKLAAMKLLHGIWKKLSGEQELEAIRTETILKITKYVKEHPTASKEELSKEIGKQITEFAKKVETM